MSIYKKLTAQDIAVIPFNAHKQYDFTSGSASSNSINHFDTRWTSESIDMYSSSSTEYGLPGDSINTIKYYQTDHLFYKNFKRDIGNRFGNKNYLNQRRDLYEKTNILSIPAGLYGHEIKPGTFFLSSSNHKVIDDTNGNLIISGTNLNNYPIDVRSNLFRLDPIKAFKRIDLNTFEGYHNGVFYLDGKKRVNPYPYYNSPDQGEFDDSYHFNPIKYENVNFSTGSIGSSRAKFANIVLDSFVNARIVSPHSEKFDFNPEDDFSITFNFEPRPPLLFYDSDGFGSPQVGQNIAPGTRIFHVDDEFAYFVRSGHNDGADDKIITTYDIVSRISSQLDDNGLSNLVNGEEANKAKFLAVGIGGSGYINSAGESGPFTADAIAVTASHFDILIEGVADLNSPTTSPDGTALTANPKLSSSFSEPLIGGGFTNTKNLLDFVQFKEDAPLHNLVMSGSSGQAGEADFLVGGMYQDGEPVPLWIANYDEVNLINKNLGFTTDITEAIIDKKILIASNNDDPLIHSLDNPLNFNPSALTTSGGNVFDEYLGLIYTSNFIHTANNPGATFITTVFPKATSATSQTTGVGPDGNLRITRVAQPPNAVVPGNIVVVGKFKWRALDRTLRYLVSKSTTKTIVPTPAEGRAQRLKTNTSGALQFKDVQAEPQYPFEIFHISSSIYFRRSDGDITSYVSGNIPNFINKTHHILCQKTGSTLQIYANGSLIGTGEDKITQQTQNTANVYIGSRGNESIADAYVSFKGATVLDSFVYTIVSGIDQLGTLPVFNSSITNAPPEFQRNYNGTIGNINIFNKALSQNEIANISESINGSPYIGNIFYQNGFVTITHPKYQNILSGSSGDGTIERLRFQGSHLIYENEYQCTIGEEEFNDTLNISARKIRSHQSEDLANFATGSLFKPYITTVGLYNEDNELLVVGKLGQPLRISDETDSTIIVRWDT